MTVIPVTVRGARSRHIVRGPDSRDAVGICHCRTCPLWKKECSGASGTCGQCGCGLPACATCAVRCANRDDRDSWLQAVGGTAAFDRAAGQHPTLGDLPSLIWIADTATPGTFPAQDWWAWRTRDTIRADGTPSERTKRLPGRRLWVGWGPDPLIERWWTRRHGWCHQAEGLFHAAVAPNFSMYGNHPRFEHLLSMRRSLLAAALLENRGIPCAPHLYWWRDEDIRRWIEWADRWPPIAVSCNLSTVRTRPEWVAHMRGLTQLVEGMTPQPRWLIGGVRARSRIADLNRLFDRWTLITAAPVMLARRGRQLSADGATTPLPARPYDLAAETGRVLQGWVRGG